MKPTKYIAFLFTLFIVACTSEDYVIPYEGSNTDSQVQFVGRITPFEDYDVATRAQKTEEKEYKAKTVDLLIFDNNDICVYKYHSTTGELTFPIDRGTDTSDPKDNIPDNGDFQGIPNDQLTACKVYAIANVPETSTLGKGNRLSDFLALTTEVKGVDIPSTGIPMLGTYNGTLDLGVNSNIPSNTPIEIPFVALYSKMVFTINVVAEQNNTNKTPHFMLEEVKVKNVASSVKLSNSDMSESSEGTTDGSNSNVNVLKNGDEAKLFPVAVTGNNIAYDRNGQITVSFYLPERYCPAKEAANSYEYPFLEEDNSIRPEDENLRQRYKPEIAADDATCVILFGIFTNHQGHEYDVDYTIYVGNDNYSNFDIVRNRQYNNIVTVKGIQYSKDQSGKGEAVSIDHRVNITRSQPAILSLLREVLLDSHFEIRPLRIRSRGLDNTGVNAVKVEVLNHTTTNWMRLERSGGVGTSAEGEGFHITEEGAAKGKRKYFTYNLVSGKNASGATDGSAYPLNESYQVVVPLDKTTNDCVWIYVDECLEVGDGIRSGEIKVTYGTGTTPNNFVATNNEAYPPVQYTINQRKLFGVTYGSNNYNIEYYEEYLHNFDSEENTGLTEYEGMPWGLNGVQLSYNHQAILLHNSGWESLTKNIRNAVLGYSPYYDFYLTRDFNRSTYYFENEDQYTGIVHNHNGFVFCNEIIAEVNSTAHSSETSDDIKILTLAQEAKSAIEYCYNKNKRDANGNVVLNGNTGWYLPAIDEAEEIMMSQYTFEGSPHYSYARFEDFQNKYYWSSQPAFYQNIFLFDRSYLGPGDRMGHYMTDNPNYARATKVHFNGGDPTVSTNYDIESSGMIANSYYQYIYFKAGGSILQFYPDVKTQHSHIVDELIKSNSTNNAKGDRGAGFGSDTNGKYFYFKWDNGDVDETTEKVYAPMYQDGYKHRTNDKARVRCVRKK